MSISMDTTPKYEIWGARLSSDETSPSSFLEDCWTLEDARTARDHWQLDPDQAAWIQDKDTGAQVR